MKKEKIQMVIVGIMCLLIASSICVQYRSINSYTADGGQVVAVQSMTENKLRDKLMMEQESYDKLKGEVDKAQEELDNLRKVSAADSEEAKQLEEQLSELNRLLGYTEIKGKGIEIKLADADSSAINTSDSIVHDLDLVEVVNELFNAGAEAISINNQRVISTTAITCNGNVVRINNEKISVPFEIKAIGSPQGLHETLVRPGGYLDLMKSGKIKIEIKEKDDITVPKYIGTRQYEYLQVVE